MTTTTPAPVRRLSPAEIRRRYPAGGLQLLDALTAAEGLDQAIEAAKTAPGVQLTDLRPFLEFAKHAGPLRSIHSHAGGIRSSAYGVRTADGLEALRLVAWFTIGPVDIGTTVPEVIDGRTVHGLDLELLGFSGGALDDLALEVLALHTGRVDEIGGEL